MVVMNAKIRKTQNSRNLLAGGTVGPCLFVWACLHVTGKPLRRHSRAWRSIAEQIEKQKKGIDNLRAASIVHHKAPERGLPMNKSTRICRIMMLFVQGRTLIGDEGRVSRWSARQGARNVEDCRSMIVSMPFCCVSWSPAKMHAKLF